MAFPHRDRPQIASRSSCCPWLRSEGALGSDVKVGSMAGDSGTFGTSVIAEAASCTKREPFVRVWQRLVIGWRATSSH